MQTKEPKATKVRVFNLAKELKLETTDVIEYCKELGYTAVKNQLNGLEPDQVEALKDRARKGPPKNACQRAHARRFEGGEAGPAAALGPGECE